MSRWVTCLLLCFALIALSGSPAVAQYGDSPDDGASSGGGDGEKKKASKWGRKGEDGDEWGEEYEIGPRTLKKISIAREALLAEQYDKTEKILGKFKMNRLNPLERAQIYQIWAFVYYGRGDIDKTREYLELSMNENALPRRTTEDTRFQIAQLYLQESNWAKAAESLELWLTIARKPNAGAFHTIALTYYQLDDLDKALLNSTKAVEMTDKPQEGWLQLLLALRLTNKQYEESIPILETLVTRYPKKTYWLQLSTVHGALENYKESLVQLQLAYQQGLLDQDEEFRRLAELMLFQELPYGAAQVMETGLEGGYIKQDSKAYELLSNSRIAAREFEASVEPLGRAAELADTGELYIRLAQVHLQGEQWEEAANALRAAMDKGGLPSKGDAQLLMGIAYYSKKEPQKALTWFGRASQHRETEKEATTWLRYIERELQSG